MALLSHALGERDRQLHLSCVLTSGEIRRRRRDRTAATSSAAALGRRRAEPAAILREFRPLSTWPRTARGPRLGVIAEAALTGPFSLDTGRPYTGFDIDE